MAYLTAAIIILIIILILIGVLVVPFQISMQLYRMGSVNEGHFKLSWLKIRLIHRKFPSDKKEKKKPKEEKKGIDFNRIPRIISLSLESLPYIIDIFEAFLRSVSVHRISIDTIIGFDSPADTAIIGGYLWGVASIINLIPNTCLTVQHDFQKERIDGSFVIELKLILLWIAIEGLKALTKKPVRSLFGELRKVRG
ncbi:MAG: DUF2953 domain-containing protein [Methanobacterium sp.]